jgi:hypothetical protein
VAGAVIGYELTSSDAPPPVTASAPAPTVLPAVAVLPGGVAVAVVGRF